MISPFSSVSVFFKFSNSPLSSTTCCLVSLRSPIFLSSFCIRCSFSSSTTLRPLLIPLFFPEIFWPDPSSHFPYKHRSLELPSIRLFLPLASQKDLKALPHLFYISQTLFKKQLRTPWLLCILVRSACFFMLLWVSVQKFDDSLVIEIFFWSELRNHILKLCDLDVELMVIDRYFLLIDFI